MMIEVLIALVFPLALVAVCAWFRFGPSPKSKWNWLPICCLGIVTLGSVFGRDFFHIPIGPIPVTFDRVVLGFSIAFFFWRFLCSRESLDRLNWLDTAILIWLAVITASTLTGKFTVMNNMPLSRMLFFNWVPAMLYFVTRQAKLSSHDLNIIYCVLGLFGIYLALTAVAEMRSLDSLVFPSYITNSEAREFFGRGRGPFLNPVANGTFQIVCLCCVLTWWPQSRNRGKILIIGVAMVLCIGIYATLTRSNWLALLAAFVWLIFLPATPKTKGTMLVAATLAGLLLFPIVSDKIFSFKRDQDVSVADMEKSAQLRPMFALIAWKMFQDRPVAGVGFGQYTQYKKPYLRDANSNKPLMLTKPFMQHNVFLAYVTELGLIGLGALFWLLFHAGKVGWRVWKNQKLPLNFRQLGLILLAFLSCYCINGMFHDTSIVPQMHILMMFLLGLANNIYSRMPHFENRDEDEWLIQFKSASMSTESKAA